VTTLCWLHIFGDLHGFAPEDIVRPHKHLVAKNHFDRSAIRFEWTGCKDAAFWHWDIELCALELIVKWSIYGCFGVNMFICYLGGFWP
jgi:hypothetical protein